MKTAFVTGATGFLGINLIKELEKQNWNVIAMYLPGTDLKYLPNKNVLKIPGNILDYDILKNSVPEDIDVIFHLASNTSAWAKNDHIQYIDNVMGVSNIVKIAFEKNVKRLVYTSSISAYGYQTGKIINEKTTSNAMTCNINYCKTKYLAESIIKNAVKDGLNAIILNPCNIIGPYDTKNWTNQFIKPIYEDKLLVIPPGEAMWCNVKDIVLAHINAIYKGGSGENYLLGGVKAKFLDIVNEIETIMEKKKSFKTTNKYFLKLLLFLLFIKSKFDKKEPVLTKEKYYRAVGSILCDYSKAVNILDYTISPISEMINDAYKWLQKENLLESKINNNNYGYVNVIDEPKHIECFKNEYFRVYNAKLKPGESTLYHKHSKDTVYIVLNGGKIHTKPYIKNKKSSTNFPKSVKLYSKIYFLIQKLFTSYIKLPDDMIFILLNKRLNYIHKAITHTKNNFDMEMMGIEISKTFCKKIISNLDDALFKIEYRNKFFSIFNFELKYGESSGTYSFESPFIIVCIRGFGNIYYENQMYSLKKSDSFSSESISNFKVVNQGAGVLKLLIIKLGKQK
ncbi:MAG: NAD-dependent epimerase/dehydratase family protein [Clostridiales bacterium]